MSNLIQTIIITAVIVLALVYDFKRDLMMLQLNSYRNDRYQRWLRSSGDSVSVVRCVAMVMFMIGLLSMVTPLVASYLSLAAAVAALVTLVGKHYKKPLVFTSRAVRIYSVIWILAVLIASAAIILFTSHYEAESALGCMNMALLACYAFSPYLTMLANTILAPMQSMINRRYYNDAKRILDSMPDLKIVGVTGSYGKTSTKHYLYRILSEKFETVMTPGSFNTTLGVVRTVREYLHPYTEVFIVEMGAKQNGDIKEICDLVHPTVGIVTAVGPQHLESFKTIENVQATKFELVDALPRDGFAVINNDFEFIANRKVENVDVVRYGVKNRRMSEAVATDIVTSATGTDFTLEYNGETQRFHTKLVGECNVSNLIAAIVTALHLGVDTKSIVRAVERIEQVEHRLNIKRTAGGIVIIDDAFNSNPSGSAMALDVLGSMTSGKRIVITPGMIELGERQYELNRDFGRKISETADIAIVVGNYNREAIVEGIKENSGSTTEIHESPDFQSAQAYMQSIARQGDIVLYENDLPDTFK